MIVASTFVINFEICNDLNGQADRLEGFDIASNVIMLETFWLSGCLAFSMALMELLTQHNQAPSFIPLDDSLPPVPAV